MLSFTPKLNTILTRWDGGIRLGAAMDGRTFVKSPTNHKIRTDVDWLSQCLRRCESRWYTGHVDIADPKCPGPPTVGPMPRRDHDWQYRLSSSSCIPDRDTTDRNVFDRHQPSSTVTPYIIKPIVYTPIREWILRIERSEIRREQRIGHVSNVVSTMQSYRTVVNAS